MCWRSIRWQHWLCLSLILCFAISLRCINLSRNSLWTDEYLSLECSSGWGRYDLTLAGMAASVPDFITLQNAKPLSAIWLSVAREENHPPLYFVLLRLWRDLFGDSPIAIRSLSIVASTIALLVLFAIGVVMHGPRAGLWAALLMAVAIPQIQQSQDARAYIPMTAACLGAALSMLLIERSGPSRRCCVSLFLCALTAPLLHYMAFATLAAMFIYSAVVMHASARKWVLICLTGSIGVFALVWGPALLSQHYRMMDATGWLAVNPAHPGQSSFASLCTLPARMFLDLDFDLLNAPAASFSVVALIMPIFFCRKHRGLLLWWIWLIVPVLTIFVIDLSSNRHSMAMIKYTLAAAPAAYLMLGLLAAKVRQTGWIPAATIAGCCLICVPGSYVSRLPDWREVSKFISQTSRSGDPVMFVDTHPSAYANDSLLSVSYYMAQQRRVLFVIDRPPTGAVMVRLATARHACVIADSYQSLKVQIIPGLKLHRAELLAGMALVGTVDPPAAFLKIAKGTVVATAIEKHS